MSDQVPMTVDEERELVAKGGIWSDENLAQALDWKGETVGDRASANADVTHTPKTTEQITTEILEQAKITPDVLNAVTSRVESSILKGKSSGTSLIEMVEKALNDQNDRTQLWIDSQTKRLDQLAKTADLAKGVKRDDIDRLDEKLRILEEKVSAIIIDQASNKTEEFAIINEASKILKERRATEELEVESTPSIVGRMETKAEQLQAQLRALEPHVETSGAAVVAKRSAPAAARRKFGKRM